MQKKSTSSSGFLNSRVLVGLLLCAATACFILIPIRSGLAFLHPQAPSNPAAAGLTFEERVSYQRAIEDVYWRHRIWPRDRGERPDPKPSLDAVMSQAQLEKKVADYLHNSQALEDYWQRPITAEQLQAEMDRMAKHTKQPEVLHELFEALGNDPFVIAECLARPELAERLLADSLANQVKQTSQTYNQIGAATVSYRLPTISDPADGCTDDTWAATSVINAPLARIEHTAIWTGSEMIVWAGELVGGILANTGGRYNPDADSWLATSTANAASARKSHTAVWTGNEMIIWGGYDGSFSNSGGRYDPTTNGWTATSMTNAPVGRDSHTAVWSGGEMIIWAGYNDSIGVLNTGGRYALSTNSWTATGTTNAPIGRANHTAVWTGSEMIVWGGSNGSYLNSGGRYCAQSGPTPTPTPTVTPTPTSTPRVTPRPRPAPHPRPTPR